MELRSEFENQILKWAAIVGAPVLILMTAFLLYYASIKPLNLVSMQSEAVRKVGNETTGMVTLKQIFPRGDSQSERFYIPLAGNVLQEDIRIENSYLTRQMAIVISNMQSSFYDEGNGMYGDMTGIQAVQLGQHGEDVVILISLSGIYEYEMILENQKLSLKLTRPGEAYDRILVLDAGHGGSDAGAEQLQLTESKLNLQIANLVKDKLEAEGVRVYMTRNADEDISAAERLALAQDADADLYLEIHVSESDAYGISAYYNDQYFLPRLTNVNYADLLVRRTAEAVSGMGRGIYVANEDDTLMQLTMPALKLEVGSLANEKEAELLGREDYLEDIASGIVRGLIEAYAQLGD